jgi:PncC family amidohydrolase
VSEPVVRAMAEGAARRLGADVAVAVTGIAGPGGGSEEKPVGTVWFATWLRGAIEARRIVFPGTREEIRARAVQSALYQLSLRLSPMPV